MISIALVIIFVAAAQAQTVKYEPNWDSLDARPLPEWYDEAKIGIFLHWGVFSVPGVTSEWFWNYWRENRSEEVVDFIKNNFPPDFSYQDFGRDFTAEFYDPDQWADIFEASGARYIVLTTKHHEGFTLWPSKTSFSWNAVDIGPHRDLVGPLAEAVRKKPNLRFGVYHSLFEWFNRLWLEDEANNFTTNTYAREKAIPELHELVELYKPEVIWSDGEAEAPDTYWGSMEFLAWLYNESPVKDTVVVNDRWGINTSCTHGGFYNCFDRYSPGVKQHHKWENAFTIDQSSWGYRRNAHIEQFFTMEQMLELLIQTISCGGNALINVGPTKEGTIAPIYEERLRQLGSWLSMNGEAIYGTTPWIYQNDTINNDVWYVQKGDVIYALLTKWPPFQTLGISSVSPQPDTRIELLTYGGGDLEYSSFGKSIFIHFPNKKEVKSQWAYVLKFTNLQSEMSQISKYDIINNNELPMND